MLRTGVAAEKETAVEIDASYNLYRRTRRRALERQLTPANNRLACKLEQALAEVLALAQVDGKAPPRSAAFRFLGVPAFGESGCGGSRSI